MKILVYVGDAKKNKGFNALPDILGRLLQMAYSIPVIFTVQYTLTSPCPVLAETDAALAGIAQPGIPGFLLSEIFGRMMNSTRLWPNMI